MWSLFIDYKSNRDFDMLKVLFEDTNGQEHEAKVLESVQVGDMVRLFYKPDAICAKIIKVEVLHAMQEKMDQFDKMAIYSAASNMVENGDGTFRFARNRPIY